MIVYGSKDQVKGDIAHKCKEVGCSLKQNDLYYLCQNSAEGGIKELKRGARHKTLKIRSPKILWDDCVELDL